MARVFIFHYLFPHSAPSKRCIFRRRMSGRGYARGNFNTPTCVLNTPVCMIRIPTRNTIIILFFKPIFVIAHATNYIVNENRSNVVPVKTQNNCSRGSRTRFSTRRARETSRVKIPRTALFKTLNAFVAKTLSVFDPERSEFVRRLRASVIPSDCFAGDRLVDSRVGYLSSESCGRGRPDVETLADARGERFSARVFREFARPLNSSVFIKRNRNSSQTETQLYVFGVF